MAETDDRHFMEIALEEARKRAEPEEVPVGAVLVFHGEIIAKNHNRCVTTRDPTAHAEILVLREAAKKLKNYRLPGTVLYVTVEPCAMCVGAMIQARISRLVFGTCEEKTGMVQSRVSLLDDGIFNHRVETVGGVLAAECRALIQEFFRVKRQK